MRKALVVGIDDYKNCPLNGCCNDAREIAKLLKTNEDDTPNFDVKVQLNVSCKSDLINLITECFNGNSEIGLFYYSGHGYIDNFGGYLATPDFSKDNNGVSLSDLINVVNESKCRNKIIILDSCYSGDIGKIPITDINTSVIGDGVTILTSSKDTETSTESNGHGLFTSLLLEALNGGAADVLGNITAASVYSYIDKSLGAWHQRPVFKTNITQFTSLRNVKPRVDKVILRKVCQYFVSENSCINLDPSFEPTNTNSVHHEIIPPYAKEENTKIFSDLQKLVKIGLVAPVDEEHMYFAAMHSKSCRLTEMGKQYWRLFSKGRL